MSHLSALLEQKAPLEPHEVDDLQVWLACLEDDVATFGTTPQDENLMARIRAKIERSRGEAA